MTNVAYVTHNDDFDTCYAAAYGPREEELRIGGVQTLFVNLVNAFGPCYDRVLDDGERICEWIVMLPDGEHCHVYNEEVLNRPSGLYGAPREFIMHWGIKCSSAANSDPTLATRILSFIKATFELQHARVRSVFEEQVDYAHCMYFEEEAY